LLDARLCISYLTIEFKREVPTELAAKIGDWVFGCDVCQDVCPWNKSFARPFTSVALELDPSLATLELESLTEINESDFARLYGWTPLERAGAAGIRRNARIAAASFAGEAPCQTH
jgi:epoxyqueuosine reductase